MVISGMLRRPPRACRERMFRGLWNWGSATVALPRRTASLSALCAIGLAATGGLASCSFNYAAPGPPTFYVSPSGNDTAAGTSTTSAWRTLRRASTAVIRPGIRLLFQGGRQFTGQLRITPGDAGDPAIPVIVGSYGQGRATIISRRGAGVVVYNTSGVNISNLIVVGKHSPASGSGINLYADLPGNRKLDHVDIDHVDSSGFAYGIGIGSGNGTSGFRNVRISNSALHDNLVEGLLSYGLPFNAAAPKYPHSGIEVSHVVAYHNLGDPASKLTSSGSGIVLGDVSGATVSWTAAYDNGGSGGDRHAGPQGIWTYDSTGVVIEHCLSHNNHSANFVDGGGMDLDQNVSHSTMQYNLSYGNNGAGFLVYTGQKNSSDTGNLVRFNISSGDAQRWPFYAGITIIGRISNAAIYQNTVIASSRSNPYLASLAVQIGPGLHRVTIRNNIFVTYQPGPILVARLPYSRTDLLMQGNDYFGARGPAGFRWGNATYTSLAEWQSMSGQETRAGRQTGFDVNPGLVGPVLGLGFTQAALGDGAGFALRPDSPLVGSGLDLWRLFRIQRGPVNYAGRPLANTTPNIGAQ